MVKNQSQRVSKTTKKTSSEVVEVDSKTVEKRTKTVAKEKLPAIVVGERKPNAEKVEKKSNKIGLGETIFKPTIKSVEGTSYHGATVSCTAGDLLELFPNCRVRVCFDSQYEFYMENSNGDVITIYDHGLDKYGVKLGLKESWVFNIGGFSKEVTKQAESDINRLLKKLKK